MPAPIVPAAAPVPLEQVKAFLRVAGSEEDALIAGLVRTAAALCEAFTRSTTIEREVEETVSAGPAWTRLAQAPVRAITGLWTIAEGGETIALAADDYAVDIDSAGDGWVRVTRGVSEGRVLVRYSAGLAQDWNGVPEPLRHGIVRLAAHLYTHRDSEDGGAPPAAVTALWMPYRRLRLG
jgi:uncharacterized phiE125 gp8 family phage protein